MSFVLEFLAEAVAEVECITGDYEARSAGLGSRFRSEIESVCAAMVQHPLLWRLRPGGWRRVNPPGFPYYVAFVTDEERASRRRRGARESASRLLQEPYPLSA